jgi:hypothetical protein
MSRVNPAVAQRRLATRPPAEVAYIAALVRHQHSLALNETAFAALLGISEGLWRAIKTGRRAMGLKILSAGMDLVPYAVTTAAYGALLERARQRGSGQENGHKKASSTVGTCESPEGQFTPGNPPL